MTTNTLETFRRRWAEQHQVSSKIEPPHALVLELAGQIDLHGPADEAGELVLSDPSSSLADVAEVVAYFHDWSARADVVRSAESGGAEESATARLLLRVLGDRLLLADRSTEIDLQVLAEALSLGDDKGALGSLGVGMVR